MGKRTGDKETYWSELGRLFDGNFPFPRMDQLSKMMHDPLWAEQFMQQAAQQSFTQSQAPPSAKPAPKKARAKVSHSAKFVRVRIETPPSTNPHALRVFVAPVTVTVEGLPDNKPLTVNLPREIATVGIRSTFSKGVLELRLPKKQGAGKGRQINITVL